MILVWRGWGLLGTTGFVLILAWLGVGADLEPRGLKVAGLFLSIFLSGLLCLDRGLRWNRHGNYHTLYYIPLQFWGYLYLGMSAIFLLGVIWTNIRFGREHPGGMTETVVAAVALGVLAGFNFFLIRAIRSGQYPDRLD